jgi:hypothetical protein
LWIVIVNEPSAPGIRLRLEAVELVISLEVRDHAGRVGAGALGLIDPDEVVVWIVVVLDPVGPREEREIGGSEVVDLGLEAVELVVVELDDLALGVGEPNLVSGSGRRDDSSAGSDRRGFPESSGSSG